MAEDKIKENVGLAFGAVIAAGGSTAIGAAVVFFPKLVKLASRRVLASSLGISAGVMTYVSFVEIFQKSVVGFNDGLDIEDEDKRFGRANLYATLSFFSGVVIMMLIDVLVKRLSGEHGHHHHEAVDLVDKDDDEVVIPHCVGCSPDPVAELNEWQRSAAKEEDVQRNKDNITAASGASPLNQDEECRDAVSNDNDSTPDNEQIISVQDVKQLAQEEEDAIEKHKLVNMGLKTALAIAIHNFPEGLATFVAVLQDPSIGLVLAIAIAIHNIPEGFCVALPVYYATGNRFKAFLWGTFSGMTEPIGALIGWLVLSNGLINDALYGVMFGLVAGMMVMISLKELLPTAYRYDPEDTVVTYSLSFGMVVIALSLVLFYL